MNIYSVSLLHYLMICILGGLWVLIELLKDITFDEKYV